MSIHVRFPIAFMRIKTTNFLKYVFFFSHNNIYSKHGVRTRKSRERMVRRHRETTGFIFIYLFRRKNQKPLCREMDLIQQSTDYTLIVDCIRPARIRRNTNRRKIFDTAFSNRNCRTLFV